MGRLLINSSNKALVNAQGKAYAVDADELAGALPLTIQAAAGKVMRLIRYGKCTQASTPTPSSPVDIICNNGAVGETAHANPEAVRAYSELYTAEGKTEGKYIDDSGVEQIVSTGAITDYIPLSPSTPYRLAWTRITTGVYTRVHLYDSNKNWLAMAYKEPDLYVGNKTADFNTTPQTAYIRITFHKSTTYISLVNNIVASVPDLLALTGYVDEADIIGGKVTRKVGVKVLDGTEAWNSYNVTQGVLFRTQISDSVSDSKNILGVLCNAYQTVYAGYRDSGTLSGSARNYDFLNDNYTTLDAWKAYLAAQYANGTPVIVVYPLATATTEWATPQSLQTGAGSNTISSTYAEAEADITYKT